MDIGGGHISAVVEMVLVITLFLIIATFSMGLAKTLRLPHSIFLVLIGIALGSLATYYYESLGSGFLSEIISSIENYNLAPDTIFYIFLPTLIFETSYNINTRELFKELPSILMLAVPALLVSIFLVGSSLHFIGGLDFYVSLLIGAIISATDPVAVIAIFKDLGAPKRLNLLVEGESLFNDATSIVIFSIILGFIEVSATGSMSGGIGEGLTSGIGSFLLTFCGGVAVGLAVGYIFSSILDTVKVNPVIEIILTTMAAYISFIAAHHYLGVSGVMSTVTAGLYLGGFGRTSISHQVQAFMGDFWETLSFSANAILFLSIGLLMSHYLSYESVADLLPLLVVSVVAVNLSRALSVHTMLPVLSKWKIIEPISFAYQTMLWWGGGLRGAIAIALSLSLIGSSVLPKETVETILLLTFGVVMVSLLVNAISIEFIIKLLGLDKLEIDEIYSREMAVLHSKKTAHDKILSLVTYKRYYPEVHKKMLEEYEKEEEALRSELSSLSAMSRDEKVSVITREALLVEKNSYYESFVEGELSSLSMKDLQLEVDKEIDRLKVGAELFSGRHQLGRDSFAERLMAPFEKLNNTYTTNTLIMRFEKAKATITAMQTVARFLDEKQNEFHELRPLCQKMLHEFIEFKKSAEVELSGISLNFPEYVDKVVGTLLKLSSLRVESIELDRMFHLGQIPDMAFVKLKEKLALDIVELTKKPLETIEQTPEFLLRKIPFFDHLGANHITRLAGHLVTETFLKDEELIKEGDEGEKVFIITGGVVLIYKGEKPSQTTLATLKAGDIFGEMSLVSHKPCNATAVALSHGTVLTLKKSHFDETLKEEPELKEKIINLCHEREEGTA